MEHLFLSPFLFLFLVLILILILIPCSLFSILLNPSLKYTPHPPFPDIKIKQWTVGCRFYG